jgi:exopolyphosphatase/guanosine-5'-triphosphate,3'-diphosphate pyrophosphatase
VIDIDSIKTLNSLLARMTRESRANHPCIGPERADLVATGCAVLGAVCRRWPVDRIRVADRGIREGLLLSMMHEDGHLTPPADKPGVSPILPPSLPVTEPVAT